MPEMGRDPRGVVTLFPLLAHVTGTYLVKIKKTSQEVGTRIGGHLTPETCKIRGRLSTAKCLVVKTCLSDGVGRVRVPAGRSEGGGPLVPPAVPHKVPGAKMASRPTEPSKPASAPTGVVGKPHRTRLLVCKELKFAPRLAVLHSPGKPWFGGSKPFPNPASPLAPRSQPSSRPPALAKMSGCLETRAVRTTKSYPPCFPNTSFRFFLSEMLSTNTKVLIFQLIGVENASYSYDS